MKAKFNHAMFAAGAAAFLGMLSGHRLHGLRPQERRMWLRLWLAILLLTMAAAIFSGCSGLEGSIRALGSDTNSVSIDVSTPWGSGHFRRNSPSLVQ